MALRHRDGALAAHQCTCRDGAQLGSTSSEQLEMFKSQGPSATAAAALLSPIPAVVTPLIPQENTSSNAGVTAQIGMFAPD